MTKSNLVDVGLSLMIGVVVLVMVTTFIDDNIASFTGLTLVVVGFLAPFFGLRLLKDSTKGIGGKGR